MWEDRDLVFGGGVKTGISVRLPEPAWSALHVPSAQLREFRLI
nr:hypothetical protein [Candidatus Sigynarchaeota archaeon]